MNPSEITGGVSIDATLGLNAMNAAAASAGAYLTATLEATTPEVRRLFGEYLNQSLMAHETLTGLAVKRNWLKPYESAEDQLKISYAGAQKALGRETQ
jgi:spore coat protein CotF